MSVNAYPFSICCSDFYYPPIERKQEDMKAIEHFDPERMREADMRLHEGQSVSIDLTEELLELTNIMAELKDDPNFDFALAPSLYRPGESEASYLVENVFQMVGNIRHAVESGKKVLGDLYSKDGNFLLPAAKARSLAVQPVIHTGIYRMVMDYVKDSMSKWLRHHEGSLPYSTDILKHVLSMQALLEMEDENCQENETVWEATNEIFDVLDNRITGIVERIAICNENRYFSITLKGHVLTVTAEEDYRVVEWRVIKDRELDMSAISELDEDAGLEEEDDYLRMGSW